MIDLLMVNIPQTESIVFFLEQQGGYNITTYDNDMFYLIDLLKRKSFDVVITTDLDKNKFQCVEAARRNSPLSAIIHISKSKDCSDITKAFKAGAHDYIRMPFSYAEFSCRIKAKYNRFCKTQDAHILRYGGYELLLDTSRLKYKDAVMHLTSKEFVLLSVFFNEPMKIFSLDELQMEVYGDAGRYIQKCFNNVLMRVRKKISLNPVIEIRYVSRKGYALVEK